MGGWMPAEGQGVAWGMANEADVFECASGAVGEAQAAPPAAGPWPASTCRNRPVAPFCRAAVQALQQPLVGAAWPELSVWRPRSGASRRVSGTAHARGMHAGQRKGARETWAL